MRGAPLRFLERELEGPCRGVGQAFANQIGAVPDNDGDRCRRDGLGGAQDVLNHRPTGNLVQDLGQLRLHARALAGREHDDVGVG